MKHTRLLCGALAALALASPALAQMPPVPQPGPEHALLKGDAGTWDATVEVILPPGAPPVPASKGTETNTLMGGLWLVSDFKGDMMGSPFTGHGIAGWDPSKKKYVSVWTDSMSTSLMTGESTYDAASKTMTGWMEGPDMTGKVTKTKLVTEYKDPDTRVFTMYGPGPDGKEVPGLRITYKRRK
jgi:uncharacterized protein DUF1579